MRQFVQSLTDEFMTEANSSPRMFEDLASMEHYMAESYDGRAFVEILQNADDAGASSLALFSDNNDYVIANNGRPFNREDLVAICRSGASSKRRGTGIGYRGIGFKSATSISTEIIIYSSGVYFTFSKSKCAKMMNRRIDQVPTVRIPFLVEEEYLSRALRQKIKQYEAKGYTTFFVFKDGNRDKLLTELTEISSGWLLFLNNIERVFVDFSVLSKEIIISRRPLKKNRYLFSDKKSGQQWQVIYGKNNIAVAFRYDKHIVPCNGMESTFHCFLPTQDQVGYPFKVNADFSTDPSRKHIIVNDDNTRRSINSIASLLVELLSDTTFDNQPYLIDLISTVSGISEASTILDQTIISRLKEEQWIPLQNGSKASAFEHRIVPSWFDKDSKNKVFSIVHRLSDDQVKEEISRYACNMDDLLLRCGCQLYGINEYSAILKSVDAVSTLKDVFLGKLWGYALRSVLYLPSAIESFFLKDREGKIVIFSDVKEEIAFSSDFCAGMKGVLNTEEITKISKMLAFKSFEISKTIVSKNRREEQIAPKQKSINYSKWKTPIQNCMVSEQFKHRSPKDVSRKSIGYDIESTDIDGTVRYISVKPVEMLGDTIVLTEREYSFFERHGNSFCVFVIERDNPQNNMLIEDVNTISFEKRVREWEWVSGKYAVKKPTHEEEIEGIDSRFIKEFSMTYLNHIQIALLKLLCDGGDVATFEADYSCKTSSIITQINGIVDFYIGDNLIESNMKIKGKYLGAIRYFLDGNQR